jgi:8-oxo-dGTP pyrophosphatase MutT (NUDIX family)
MPNATPRYAPYIVAVDHLDVGFAAYRWPFAEARRGDIAAYFATLKRTTPKLWNGRVLLMRDLDIAEGTLHGAYFEVGFADFMAWRDWGFPDPAVTNCFSMGALRGSDGGFLLGVMSEHTANAGKIYFPAGTPDPDDVRGDTVDLMGNVVREIAEETGLTAADFSVTPGWHAVVAGARVALMKAIALARPAEDVRAAILRYLATEPHPELSDIRVVRSAADFDANMPAFVTAYLSHIWATEGAAGAATETNNAPGLFPIASKG